MSFQKHSSFRQLLKDKGFYIALAVCLLAVGVVAAVSLFGTSPVKESDDPAPVTTAAFTTAPTAAPTTAQPVQIPVTDVADLRTAPTTAPTTAAPTTSPAPKELYVLPLTNEVCAPFSADQPLYSETMGDWRTHVGVDFVGANGQTVKAAADGTVRSIEQDVLWGDIVEIDHGFGIVTRYCGVTARGIAEGETVSVGQEIGVLSAVPCEAAEGAHLHLEVLSGEKRLDAVSVIGVEVRYKEAS